MLRYEAGASVPLRRREKAARTAPWMGSQLPCCRFDSVQSFQASFAPHAQEIMEDIPKYTNSKPILQIGEVKL